jgi:hypothetical protein
MRLLLITLFTFHTTFSFGQVEPKEEWWLEEPFRLIQTNLLEILRHCPG